MERWHQTVSPRAFLWIARGALQICAIQTWPGLGPAALAVRVRAETFGSFGLQPPGSAAVLDNGSPKGRVAFTSEVSVTKWAFRPVSFAWHAPGSKSGAFVRLTRRPYLLAQVGFLSLNILNVFLD